MKKMPCVFQRDFPADRSQRSCFDVVTPGCEWVLAGEGIATRKFDGTAVLVRDGFPYARYDAKRGKTPPVGAIPCEPSADQVTGHWPHWVRIDMGRPQGEFKYIYEAWQNEIHRLHLNAMGILMPGTYEAVGPKINSNHERREHHELIRHGSVVFNDAPRSHSGLREYLFRLDVEGIVFHHPDGRMAKIRRNDFLLPWPPAVQPPTGAPT